MKNRLENVIAPLKTSRISPLEVRKKPALYSLQNNVSACMLFSIIGLEEGLCQGCGKGFFILFPQMGFSIMEISSEKRKLHEIFNGN